MVATQDMVCGEDRAGLENAHKVKMLKFCSKERGCILYYIENKLTNNEQIVK